MVMTYVDMDGVLADFDQSIMNIFGENYNNEIAKVFWKETCVREQVFLRMPPIEEGIQMLERLIYHDMKPCIMTSTGGAPHHIDIAIQKIEWLRNLGFNDLPMAFCMSTDGKGWFARAGTILIDDRQKVCDAWNKNGGKAYLFTRDKAAEIGAEVIGENLRF